MSAHLIQIGMIRHLHHFRPYRKMFSEYFFRYVLLQPPFSPVFLVFFEGAIEDFYGRKAFIIPIIPKITSKTLTFYGRRALSIPIIPKIASKTLCFYGRKAPFDPIIPKTPVDMDSRFRELLRRSAKSSTNRTFADRSAEHFKRHKENPRGYDRGPIFVSKLTITNSRS